MHTMKKLLVASDLSRRSERAVAQAAHLSERLGAEMTVLHVVDDELPMRVFEAEREQALRSLAETTAQLPARFGERLAVRVVGGLDFQAILSAAQEEEADLIVLGTHRQNVIKEVFTGTTIERVIRNATVPVLVVKRPDPGAYTCTLAAVDLIEEGAAVLRMAHRIALGQTLYAIHILDDLVASQMRLANAGEDRILAYERDVSARCTALLNDLARSGGLPPGDYLPAVDWGSPVEQILKAAQGFRAELGVVGTRTHAKARLERFLLGSVAEQLLLGMRCDVLAVPLPEATPLPGSEALSALA